MTCTSGRSVSTARRAVNTAADQTNVKRLLQWLFSKLIADFISMLKLGLQLKKRLAFKQIAKTNHF